MNRREAIEEEVGMDLRFQPLQFRFSCGSLGQKNLFAALCLGAGTDEKPSGGHNRDEDFDLPDGEEGGFRYKWSASSTRENGSRHDHNEDR